MDCAKETGQQKIIAYLDRVEQLEDGTATAVFLVEDDEDDYRQFDLPADFLPEDTSEGEYLTITVARDEQKIQAAFRVEELDNDTAEAVLVLEDDSGDLRQFFMPADFLPTDTAAGDNLAITVARDEQKTQAALTEAREAIKNLE